MKKVLNMLEKRSKGFMIQESRTDLKYSLLKGFFELFLDTNILIKVLVLLLFITNGVILLFDDIWLGIWSADILHYDNTSYMKVYLYVSVFAATSVLLSDLLFTYTTRNGLLKVYKQVVYKLLRCDLDFFSKVPHNRIVYRLTMDQLIVDTGLVTEINMAVKSFFAMVGGVLVIMVMTFGTFSIFFLPSLIFLIRDFLKVKVVSARFSQMSSSLKSEMYAVLINVLKCTLSLRNNGKDEYFNEKFQGISDSFQNVSTHLRNLALRWLGMRINLFAAFQILGVYIFTVIATLVFPSYYVPNIWQLSFALVWVQKFRSSLYAFGPAFIRANYMMISFYRLREYIKWGDRPRGTKQLKVDLKAKALDLNNLTFSYHKGLPTLKNISMEISSRERIALIGRPGAGKHSFINMILKLYDRKEEDKHKYEVFRMFG